MKILLAGILGGHGGIQNHLRWLAKALGEEKIETLALSLESAYSPPVDECFLRGFWNENVQLRLSPYKNDCSTKILSRVSHLQGIIKIIDEFNPDIYVAVGTGWNLFIPSLLSRAKPIQIFHEVMSGYTNGWQDSRWCARLWFDEIIGQSATVAQTFSQEFGWRKSISALPALPEPLEITATLPQATQKIVPKGSAKAAVFSRLAPHKQAFWLVRQWHILKDYLSELHIHGSGAEEILIRNYIAEQGIGEQVKCFGRYPEGQAYVDMLSSYDLTLLPTIGWEGAPLVLLESMACGVPFLAYGVGGIPDYGQNNPDVWVVKPNATDFFEGLEQITTALERGEIDQKRLQRFYLDHYSYGVLKKTWLNYFENIYQVKQHNGVMSFVP
ncbi:glycosyltransferase [Leptolyngbyaceae cyanobacterium CCMR0082]|uniref:Glycosyltransferase n=1 Tax=Adonisia turfae CCMR0082 TaxID=2304604 RepID=A0A6M0SDN9_9CYAN|nr:glycosyltransferase [Adonisia turfae]NEZ65792.1 glycosyltransferase [Adonisia turfae CCMR0082]